MVFTALENSLQFGSSSELLPGSNSVTVDYAGSMLSFLLTPDATVTNTCSGFTGNPYNGISSS